MFKIRYNFEYFDKWLKAKIDMDRKRTISCWECCWWRKLDRSKTPESDENPDKSAYYDQNNKNFSWIFYKDSRRDRAIMMSDERAHQKHSTEDSVEQMHFTAGRWVSITHDCTQKRANKPISLKKLKSNNVKTKNDTWNAIWLKQTRCKYGCTPKGWIPRR
jgi:hypothetical protein